MNTICPRCEEVNRPDARFCRRCGNPVAAAAPPTYAPQPPPNPVTPTGGGPGLAGKLLIGGLAVLVLVLLAVVIVMNGRSKSQAGGSVIGPVAGATTLATTPVTATTPTTTATTVASAQVAANQLAALLQKSSGARNAVVTATQQVGNCQESPSQGIQELQQAIATRTDVLSSLPTVAVSALPGGAANSQLLVQAMQASVSADTSFIGWMNDIASFGCPVATNSDASYQAAASASQQASDAKRAFVAWWNPIASQYSLPTYNDADL